MEIIYGLLQKDMGQLNSVFVDKTDRKITDAGLKNSSAKMLPPNSVVLSSRAPIGHLAINTKPISTNQGCKGIIPSEKINTLFLYHFLKNSVELLNDLGSGTTFKELSGSKLSLVKIPLPPLPEQQRIVAILDEAFAAIAKVKANAKQNLQNAKELFESYLQGVFEKKGEGWEEKKIGEVIKYDKSQKLHKTLPYVGLENIESKSGKLVGNLETQEVKSSTFYFSKEHVLYGRLRPYLNKVLLPDFEGHCSTEIFPIKVGKEIIREFLFYWLITGTTVMKIDATWTGARMPRANMNEALNLEFAFPKSKAEQQALVRQLNPCEPKPKN